MISSQISHGNCSARNRSPAMLWSPASSRAPGGVAIATTTFMPRRYIPSFVATGDAYLKVYASAWRSSSHSHQHHSMPTRGSRAPRSRFLPRVYSAWCRHARRRTCPLCRGAVITICGVSGRIWRRVGHESTVQPQKQQTQKFVCRVSLLVQAKYENGVSTYVKPHCKACEKQATTWNRVNRDKRQRHVRKSYRRRKLGIKRKPRNY